MAHLKVAEMSADLENSRSKHIVQWRRILSPLGLHLWHNVSQWCWWRVANNETNPNSSHYNFKDSNGPDCTQILNCFWRRPQMRHHHRTKFSLVRCTSLVPRLGCYVSGWPQEDTTAPDLMI